MRALALVLALVAVRRRRDAEAAAAALRAAHPYEEPSFHVLTNVADEMP
mgnify:CR=1 FL=1